MSAGGSGHHEMVVDVDGATDDACDIIPMDAKCCRQVGVMGDRVTVKV